MTVDRIGWVGIAIAGGAAAFLLVATLTTVDETTDKTGQLQQQLKATPPASVDQVEELGKQVASLPGRMPTPRVVVTAAPGPPGAPGPAGPSGPQGDAGSPGTTTVRTVTVTVAPRTPPQPARRDPASPSSPSPSPSPPPGCTVSVLGTCLAR